MHVPPASKCCWGGGGCFSRTADYATMGDEVTISCDVLISATGFQNRDCAQMQREPSLSHPLPPNAGPASFADSLFPKAERAALDQQDDGLYLYRHMFPPRVADVAFLSECQTISIIATYGILAEYVSRVVTGKLALPPASEMEAEVNVSKEWKRGWMQPTAIRSTLVLLHQVRPESLHHAKKRSVRGRDALCMLS